MGKNFSAFRLQAKRRLPPKNMNSPLASVRIKTRRAQARLNPSRAKKSQFITRQRRDIRRGVQKRDEILPLRAARSLAEVFHGEQCAQLLSSGGGKQLVHGYALFGRAFPELPGEAVGHLDGQRAHV